jgi:hypothetical protein
MKLGLVVVVAPFLFACGGGGGGGMDADGPTYVDGFDPPAAPAGYTRFVTSPVPNIAPGDDIEMCQWLAPAATTAQDVLDFTGAQSRGGHHAVLYATTETDFAVGESHVCTTADMLSISFVGAIGGEGNSGISKLPDGLFFRLPVGEALMANTHWLNTTDDTLDGQAVLDVEFTPASDTRVTADIFANNGDTFTIPAGSAYAYDVTCPIGSDMNIAMIADHMHNDGVSAYTELIHPDGTKDMLVSDPTWAPDQQFNTIYTKYSLASPLVMHAGDTMHTHCEWQNQTNQALLFPDEMCVGQGFYFPSRGLLACEDGSWPSN